MAKLRQKNNFKFEDVVWAKIAGKYIVLFIFDNKLDNYEFYSTSHPAFSILNGLLAEESSDEIIKSLSTKYKLNLKQATRDFSAFIHQLENKKVLN